MKCDDYQLWISVYVDEALGDGETVELFSHLSGCSDCRSFLRSTLDIRNAIASTPKPRAPFGESQFAPGLVGGRVQVFPGKAASLRSFWSRRVNVPISVAALIAAVALAGLVLATSLWIQLGSRGEAERTRVVYMARMPAVEVYARPAEISVKPQ